MKLCLIPTITLLISTALFSADFAGLYDDGGWKFIKEKNEFKIYSRQMPGSNIMGFKVEGHINTPLIDLMATLRNVGYSTQWQPDLLKKISIEDRGPTEAITYSRVDMPWPLDDRDYVLHNKLSIDKKRNMLFVMSKSATHSSYASKNDAIRANIGYSNIGFKPITKNRTYVEWTLFGDPRGNIPSWVVNFYQQSFPVSFFKTLENRANNKKIPVMLGLKKMLAELNQSVSDGRAISSKAQAKTKVINPHRTKGPEFRSRP
jgi:hypothetical protein